MKKIILLLAVVLTAGLQSCTGPEGPPGYSAEAEVFEISNVNFTSDSQGSYGIVYDLNPQLAIADMILIYRRSATFNGSPVWESLPKTYYFDNGEELDYNFDFTRMDLTINIGYTDVSVLTPQFMQNQLFRVVIIPGYLSNKNQTVDLNDYNAVIKAYHINEQYIKTLK